MPHVSTSKSQVKRRGQMNKSDFSKTAPEAIPRDDLRSAYGGDENRGSRIKGKRLSRSSGKTPVR